MKIRVIREYSGVTIVIGPWAARFAWDGHGRFVNGSRWFSGWHRWRDEPEY